MSSEQWDDDDVTQVGNRGEVRAALAAQKRATQRAYLVVIAGRSVGSMYAVSPDMVIGRGDGAGVRIFDDELSRRHCRLVTEGDQVVVEDLGSRNGTLVNGEIVAGRRALADGDKIQVGRTTILKFSYHDELEATFQRQMYEAALRDPLTGAYNRKHFGEALGSEVAYSRRHGAPLSLVLFDIDFFKKVNDTHGHLAGDAVLAAVARHVASAVRREDIFARYGGEEFAVLGRGTGAATARAFAERIRTGIEALAIPHDGQVLHVTVSLGIASMPAPGIDTASDLVARADEALYAAKRGGRNRSVTHGAA